MTTARTPSTGTASPVKSWWRSVLGEYPTGVAIVTTVDENDDPVGMVVGTFTSISQDPPLVGFMPVTTSRTGALVERAGHFRVSVLGAGHEELCRAFFSSRPDDRFAIGAWEYATNGAPRLTDSIAWFDATVQNVVPAGDHKIIIGAVTEFGLGDGSAGLPLIFLKGGYGSFSVPRLEFDVGEFGDQLRHADVVREAVDEFVREVDVECVLSTVVRDCVVMLAVSNLQSRRGSSVVGSNFPFAAPLAPVFGAWSHPRRHQLWIESGKRLLGSTDDEFFAELTRAVRRRGYAISVGDAMTKSFDAIVADPASSRTDLSSLWTQIRDQHRDLANRPDWKRHVNSIQAPVFGPDGTARFELVVQGFGPGAQPLRYEQIVDSTLRASARLTELIGGRRPNDYAC